MATEQICRAIEQFSKAAMHQSLLDSGKEAGTKINWVNTFLAQGLACLRQGGWDIDALVEESKKQIV